MILYYLHNFCAFFFLDEQKSFKYQDVMQAVSEECTAIILVITKE